MSKLENNPNIDTSFLPYSGISFKVSVFGITVLDTKENNKSTLEIQTKHLNKAIFGNVFGRATIKIDAVIKKHHRRHSFFEPKYRSQDRIIYINGKKIGVLEEYCGARSWGANSLPFHHEMNKWDTLYYDNASKDVQIYCNSSLVAVAKYVDEYYNLCKVSCLLRID